MFTGIIDQCGVVEDIEKSSQTRVLKISSPYDSLELGESIAIDGVCLTVTQTHLNYFEVDVSTETDRCTTISSWELGRKVNLERALRVGDRLGGHFVTGHVETTAQLIEKTVTDEFTRCSFGPFSQEDLRYLMLKGSVAINGVSLTVNRVMGGTIEVMLIPHTNSVTNLALLQTGNRVNIEFDWLLKAVVEAVDKQYTLMKT